MASKDDKKAGKGEAKPKAEKTPKAEGGAAPKKEKGGRAKGVAAIVEGTTSQASATEAPRLRKKYLEEVIPHLRKHFGYKNPNQVPRLQKIVLNMGLGEAVQNPKIIESAVAEIAAFTGQRPVVTRAKKAIANFKLREGLAIGAMVTLRRDRMWEFLDRLITFALPRTRDFKGISPKAFDGRGNYSLGLKEQIIFPEIDYDKVDKIKGMNVSFVTSANTDEEGRALLAAFGMPFRQ
jgi:large subunit ribosomal protein L5